MIDSCEGVGLVTHQLPGQLVACTVDGQLRLFGTSAE